jgi:hypothetical protein
MRDSMAKCSVGFSAPGSSRLPTDRSMRSLSRNSNDSGVPHRPQKPRRAIFDEA